MVSKNLILKTKPGDFDLIDKFSMAIQIYASVRGFNFKYAYKQLRPGLGSHSFEDQNKGILIKRVEDLNTPCSYIILESYDQNLMEGFETFFQEKLEIYSIDELKTIARQSLSDDSTRLIPLAIGSVNNMDPEVQELILEGLKSEDHLVRINAVKAAALTRWENFIPAIKDIQSTDPVTQVREAAGLALRSLNIN